MTRLLILGGTSEAVALAQRLHSDRPDIDVTTSLAGVTSEPVTGPGAVRRGGFGGATGLEQYVRDQAIDVLVDATHPFAAVMAVHARDAAARTGVPRIKMVRPLWPLHDDDRWIDVESADGAATEIARRGDQRVLLTLGRRDLAAFAGLTGIRFIVRMIEPPLPPLSLPNADVVLARGPFSIDDELALLKDERIDTLVTKASGGEATHAKIIGARELGIPVIMLRRPPVPDGPVTPDIDGVIAWIDELTP